MHVFECKRTTGNEKPLHVLKMSNATQTQINVSIAEPTAANDSPYLKNKQDDTLPLAYIDK